MTTQTTPMRMEAWTNPTTDEFHVTIAVPKDYLWNAKPAKPSVAHLIDMPQFFGMLEDVICTKFGIEKPQTDARGHNVAA